jgi:leucyl-tRNA synthetase
MAAKTLGEQSTPVHGDPAPPYDHRAIERRWQRAWRDAEHSRSPASPHPGGHRAYVVVPNASLATPTPLELIRNYSIADAYARFARARRLPTLFSLGFDAFGPAVEHEAIQLGMTPAAWVQSAVAQRTDQFRRFGFSLDFSRVFCSSDPGTYRLSQQLFLILLEKGLIDRDDSGWRLRLGAYVQQTDGRLSGTHDIVLSHPGAWGTPIPVIQCEACGAVPVPAKDLPVRLPKDVRPTSTGNALQDDKDFVACSCPSCSAPARRETDTLNHYFDRLWQWILPCLNPDDTKTLFDDPELGRWLPAAQVVLGADDAGLLFDQRAGAKALRDCGFLTQLPDDEPFPSATMHQSVNQANPKERIHIDGLIKRSGGDALRLTLLFAAAPPNVLPWSARTLQYCHGWLSSFWSYTLPRLQARGGLPEIDDGQGAVALRVRLSRWSGIAIERVTENLEGLQMHRAVRNVMTFLLRIEDFEQRVIDQYGDLTPADSKAIADALLTAVQLVAPLTPHIAEELWAAAGRDGFVAAASWPEAKAPPPQFS